MKKTLLTIALAALSLAMSAQQKGDMYVEGSLGITGGNTVTSAKAGNETVKTTDPSALNFQIAAQYGYFVIDRLEVNLALGYSLDRSTPNRNSTADQNFYDFDNLFTIAPGVNYYFPLGEKIWYNPGVYVSVGFGNHKSQLNSSTTEKQGLTQFGLGVSLISFELRPCEHLGISLRAGDLTYTMLNTKVTETIAGTTVSSSTTNNSVNFGLNLGASIGFRCYF